MSKQKTAAQKINRRVATKTCTQRFQRYAALNKGQAVE